MFAQGSDKCVLVCSMPSHECLGLHAHSISDVQLASNEIGVFNPSPWNSPRVCASMMEVEDFLLLVFAPTFAGLWRYDGCREAVPQSRSSHLLHQNRKSSSSIPGICNATFSQRIQDGLPINPGISQPVSVLASRVQVN